MSSRQHVHFPEHHSGSNKLQWMEPFGFGSTSASLKCVLSSAAQVTAQAWQGHTGYKCKLGAVLLTILNAQHHEIVCLTSRSRRNKHTQARSVVCISSNKDRCGYSNRAVNHRHEHRNINGANIAIGLGETELHIYPTHHQLQGVHWHVCDGAMQTAGAALLKVGKQLCQQLGMCPTAAVKKAVT